MTEPMSDERLAEIAAEQRLTYRDDAWRAIDDLMAERERLTRELRARGRRHEIAEARADSAEAALARVKALHTSDYTYCVACHDEDMPCPTLRAIDGPLP